MKLSIVLIVVFFYLSDAQIDDARRIPTKGAIDIQLTCSDLYRCSLVEDTVWATDGKRCVVLINQCHLDLANCYRQQAQQPLLKAVERDICRPRCILKCPECDKPVCGINNCSQLDFASLCWMDYYNCMTGQIYTLYNEGPCKR